MTLCLPSYIQCPFQDNSLSFQVTDCLLCTDIKSLHDISGWLWWLYGLHFKTTRAQLKASQLNLILAPLVCLKIYARKSVMQMIILVDCLFSK